MIPCCLHALLDDIAFLRSAIGEPAAEGEEGDLGSTGPKVAKDRRQWSVKGRYIGGGGSALASLVRNVAKRSSPCPWDHISIRQPYRSMFFSYCGGFVWLV